MTHSSNVDQSSIVLTPAAPPPPKLCGTPTSGFSISGSVGSPCAIAYAGYGVRVSVGIKHTLGGKVVYICRSVIKVGLAFL